MTHEQVLEKLAAKHLVQSINEDLARLIHKAMTFHSTEGSEKQLAYILPKLLLRWNCVLKAGKNISDSYKQRTVLALAVLLHKYGYYEKTISDQAVKAIDDLNEGVVLSDDFFRKSPEIKKLIKTTPKPLKRRPGLPDNTTFYREKDVVCFELEGKFYAAYIHSLARTNESPVIEFYDQVFESLPTMKELEKVPAKGAGEDGGIKIISYFSVNGMKLVPDPAHQIQMISSQVEKGPSQKHLGKPEGLYAMMDLFEMQNCIKNFFK